MTGGELRMPRLTLFAHDRARLRGAMIASGLKPVK